MIEKLKMHTQHKPVDFVALPTTTIFKIFTLVKFSLLASSFPISKLREFCIHLREGVNDHCHILKISHMFFLMIL